MKEATETEDYYIVVHKDSSYDKIDDIANKNVYMFQVPTDVKIRYQIKLKLRLIQKTT